MSTVPPPPPLLLVLVVPEAGVEVDPDAPPELLFDELLPHAASATIEAATAQPIITFPRKRIVLLWFDPGSLGGPAGAQSNARAGPQQENAPT
jgi:hypothetical protein